MEDKKEKWIMKKRVLAMLLVLGMLGTCAGCASKEKEMATDESVEVTSEPIEIQVLPHLM